MHFEIIGPIIAIETIAVGRGVRDIKQLNQKYGKGHWRKLKGIAKVRLLNGVEQLAEIHWYEAHGIGKVKLKIKRPLDFYD